MKIKVIFTKFLDESGAANMEAKTLVRELTRFWGKDIDDD